jgi:hypothetical protein
VNTGRLGVGMGSIGLRKDRGVEPPEDSRPDFTGDCSSSFPIQCQRRGWGTGHWWQRWIKLHIGLVVPSQAPQTV